MHPNERESAAAYLHCHKPADSAASITPFVSFSAHSHFLALLDCQATIYAPLVTLAEAQSGPSKSVVCGDIFFVDHHQTALPALPPANQTGETCQTYPMQAADISTLE